MAPAGSSVISGQSMSSLRVLLLASLLALTACDLRPEDYSGVEASAQRLHTTWTARIAEVTASQQAMLTRVQALPEDTDGVQDVTKQLTALGASLDELARTKLVAVEADVRSRVQLKQRTLAEEALRHGNEDLQAGLSEIQTNLAMQAAFIDAAEKLAAEKKEKDGAAKEDVKLGRVSDIVDPTFGQQKGSSDVIGVTFKPGTAQLENNDDTKAGLMRIIAMANGCEQLRFEITAHTAKDGDPAVNERLSISQAETVKQYVIASGVDPKKIAKVSGVGGNEPATPEPDPGSAEEGAMPTDQLAKIRARNRRVTVTVVEPCAAPANPA